MDVRKKTYSLTLLEVLIALVLAGLILGGLLSFFSQISKQQIQIKELKKTAMPIELMRQRLIHLFGQIEQTDSLQFFYTLPHPDAVGPALFFSYQHNIDPDPDFCGNLKAMLYLNTNKQLCLATFAEKSSRQEVLLDQIADCTFQFFDTKTKQWKGSWQKKDRLPPFFTMTWASHQTPKHPLTQPFFFPNTDALITYERRHS